MLNASAVSGGGMKKEILDAGVYPGRLVGVIDLGMQEQRPYNDKPKPPQYEIMTTYEFADEFMNDEDGNPLPDKPRWLSETFPFFNLGATKATSTARYLALDPEVKHKGEWKDLLGTPCNITVIVNAGRGKNVGKTYENIASISAMRPKDVEKLPALVNPTRVFDLDAPDLDVFKGLPEWIREKIKDNLEFAASPLAVLLGEDGPETDIEPSTEVIDSGVPEDTRYEAHVANDGEEIPF